MKVYTISKNKTDIHGLWLDDKKKLYKDYIIPLKTEGVDKLQAIAKKLFNEGEKAVFYTAGNEGYIVSCNNELMKLSKKDVYHVLKLSPDSIKRLLKRYGGITIYRLNVGYIVEVYHN